MEYINYEKLLENSKILKTTIENLGRIEKHLSLQEKLQMKRTNLLTKFIKDDLLELILEHTLRVCIIWYLVIVHTKNIWYYLVKW